MGKNLTIRYSITQFSYWAASTGATSFATTYLLSRGISPGLVGTLLAAAGLLSCLTQPMLASVIDRAEKFLLTQIMQLLSALCVGFLLLQLLPGLPVLLAAIGYLAAVWCSDAIVPLLNALSVACNDAGYPINYGAARAVGSAASAIGALVLGIIIAKLGSLWMFLFLISFRLICMISMAGYPKFSKTYNRQGAVDTSCSISQFFKRYRWFCVSLLGIGCLGMFHAMTENYMIAIMEHLGGNSSNVGIALFISSMSGALVIFCFQFFRRHFLDTTLLILSGFSFLLKAVLFCFAGSIPAIYGIQLLQTVSYAFLAPTQVYYAGAKVHPADMVKGQAFITAAYALGCSGGNFSGGQLLAISVDAMLIAGIGMTLLGTLILLFSVRKSDIST